MSEPGAPIEKNDTGLQDKGQNILGKGFHFEEAMPGSGPPIVGDEIITPTAIRLDDPKNPDGTISNKAAEARGWLSAISSAYGKRELPDVERQRNVQEIVNAAVVAGVEREQIGKHLEVLGIKGVRQKNLEPTVAVDSPEETLVKIRLEMIGAIADSVVKGIRNPQDLQRYVDVSKAQGIPYERIREALMAHGIKIALRNPVTDVQEQAAIDSEKDEDFEKLKLIIDKLRTKFPGQPGEVGRLGIEVQLTEAEIAAAREYLQKRTDFLNSRPDMQGLQVMIDKVKEDKASAVLYGFGHGVIADPLITNPVFEKTAGGTIIKVSPELYRIWKSRESAIGAQGMLNSHGTSAAMLAQDLETAMQS